MGRRHRFFAHPSSSETLPSQWPTNISSKFQIFLHFLWIGGRERIGDNRRHCSAILDDSPSVICFHPIERRYSSFILCALHTLCRRCPSMICFHPITQHILHTYLAARKLHPSIDTTCIFIFYGEMEGNESPKTHSVIITERMQLNS